MERDKNNKITNESIKSWIFNNTKEFTEILTKSNFEINGVDDEIKKLLDWSNCRNGLGDRYARKLFNYTVVYNKGKTKRYSENENDTIDNHILEDFINRQINGTGIIGLFVHSIRMNIIQHPIKKSIRDEVRKRCCVVCGTRSELVCDHKNDLYNDPRVLSIETQTIDDFQALCNHCNLQKRQVNKDEFKNGELFSAKNLPQFSHLPFEFIWEKQILNINDINCKVGTYWYDPIMFQKNLFLHISRIG